MLSAYMLILFVIGGIVFIWIKEWDKLDSLENENHKINIRRKETHEIYE